MTNGAVDVVDPLGPDLRVEEVQEATNEFVRTLIDIDLKTFSEPTFSRYTAAVLLQSGGVWLLYSGERCIGSCVCVRDWDRPGEVVLLSMGIRPGFRGQGLGQRFLIAVVDKLRAKGLRSLTLTVSSSNRRALRLYESYGFERYSEMEHGDDTLVRLRLRLSDRPVVTELASIGNLRG